MNRQIDARLAAQIVEQATSVLPFDINVMDSKGAVVASTDPARIGTFHSGAQMVLGSRRIVEIDDDTAGRIPNVRPGINLPLIVCGETVGVVGLTGSLGEVRQFGKLLQSMAQLILEREALTMQLRRDVRQKEEFLRQVLYPSSGLSDDELVALAERLGIDLSIPSCAMVCRLSPDLGRGEHLDDIERIQASLSTSHPDLIVAQVSPIELAIWGSVSSERAGSSSVETLSKKRLDEIHETATATGARAAAIALGVARTGVSGIRQSWRCALDTLSVAAGSAVNTGALAASYYDNRLAALLSGLQGQWQSDELLAPLRRVLESDRDGAQLRQTIQAWFEHDAHAGPTSASLGIHRNTLDYRLKRAGEIAKLDLTSIDGLVAMYIAILLSQSERKP